MLDFGSCRPRQKEGIVFRSLGEESILYNRETRKAHVLNKTALLVWELCTGDVSLEMMEKKITSRFEIPGDYDVKSDVEEIVTNFSKEGLLTV